MGESRSENEFPTIRDLRDGLTRLIDAGLGDHPVQVLVVPDATIQAIARTAAPDFDGAKPALMVELGSTEGRIPVAVLSTDRWSGKPAHSARAQ
jgi:hypothetical protein